VKLNHTQHSPARHLARWLLVLVSLGNSIGIASANERNTERLTIGSEARAEITSADRLNYNDGSRSKLYRFTATPGELVTFQVSGALKARLAVYVDGEQKAQSKSDHDAEAVLSYKVDSTRPHLLVVSGRDHHAYGPFRLSSRVLEAYTGETLTLGAHIHDWLGAASSDLILQIEREGLYQIDMISDEFDTKLEISGDGVSATNDDGGQGTNARLIVELSPGRYTLRTQGYEHDARGLYQLSVAEYALPEGQQLNNGGALELGAPALTGLLSSETRVYTLQLDQRQLVTIDMGSDMFDSYLELEGPNVSLENDDGGDRLNARIRAVLEPGRYEVTARATGRSGTGLFTLSASGRDVPEGSGGGPLVIGERSTAELLPGLPNQHTFSVRQASEYVIDMESDDFDSYLRLYRDGEEIDKDDDGGRALNARIQRRLSPGDYTIEASDVGDDGGRYQIVVRQR